MSNIGLVIEERERRVGNFMVGRLLPFRDKRMVGPFIFIDHMGPVAMKGRDNMDVGPHPHIGLSTLTYLFEGSIMHRDGLGTEVEITPGAVNWMTAGKGLVHSERTPDRLRDVSGKTMHGLQIWVALPLDKEEMAPAFQHVAADDLPQWEADGAHYKLVAGEVMGQQSPVAVYSNLYLLEIKALKDHQVWLGGDLYGESGLYILEGEVHTEGEIFGPRQILVANDPSACGFTMRAGATIYLFGGDPLPEERFIYWNFVASSQEKLEAAKERWRQLDFILPPGEHDPIPLPGNQPFYTK